MDVTVIIPVYKPDENLLERIRKTVRNQKYRGKVNVIEVNRGLGLAESLNYGIKKARTKIVVSLHCDCVPASRDWLSKLIEPLKKPEVVASVSKVELPYEFWKKFDYFARILSAKEQGILTPGMDEKGCAYKRSVLLKAGLFEQKIFRTAGEDVDMLIKLKRLGEIAYPDCKLFHYHKHTFKKRLKKEFQLSNGFGALFGIYGRELPRWYLGLIKSLPILGYPLFLAGISVKKLRFNSIPAVPLYLLINLIYSYGFWKGFFMKRETV